MYVSHRCSALYVYYGKARFYQAGVKLVSKEDGLSVFKDLITKDPDFPWENLDPC